MDNDCIFLKEIKDFGFVCECDTSKDVYGVAKCCLTPGSPLYIEPKNCVKYIPPIKEAGDDSCQG